MHYSAKGGHAIACRLSVRPSVCNVDINCDDIDWNSSKIISRLVSLGCSLSADPNVTGLLQGEQPEIIALMGWGAEKSDFWRTEALISLQRGKTGPRLLSVLIVLNVLSTVPTSTTLDDFEGLLCSPFA